jgi:hypothetical protein
MLFEQVLERLIGELLNSSAPLPYDSEGRFKHFVIKLDAFPWHWI